MKPRTYQLLVRCIEDGTRQGIQRAHKHTDTPTREILEQEVVRAIALELSEWFDIGEEYGQ